MTSVSSFSCCFNYNSALTLAIENCWKCISCIANEAKKKKAFGRCLMSQMFSPTKVNRSTLLKGGVRITENNCLQLYLSKATRDMNTALVYVSFWLCWCVCSQCRGVTPTAHTAEWCLALLPEITALIKPPFLMDKKWTKQPSPRTWGWAACPRDASGTAACCPCCCPQYWAPLPLPWYLCRDINSPLTFNTNYLRQVRHLFDDPRCLSSDWIADILSLYSSSLQL